MANILYLLTFGLEYLIFFCIAKGNNPFRDASNRDNGITNNIANTFVIEYMPEAHDLDTKILKQISHEKQVIFLKHFSIFFALTLR